MTEVIVAEEFSPDLGGRYIKDGPYSGQAFRDAVLLNRLDRAIRENDVLRVNFEGVSGTPTSFLEEAFGGIVRAKPEWSLEDVLQHLDLSAGHSERLSPFMALAKTYIIRAVARRIAAAEN